MPRALTSLLDAAPYVLLLALSAVVAVLATSARDASAETAEAMAGVRPAVLTAAADSAEIGALMTTALAESAPAAAAAGPVEFVFYFGLDDCSDKVVPEVAVLNRIHRARPGAVRAYWAPTPLVGLEQVVADYAIEFPVVEGHPEPIGDQFGTPFVLVADRASGALLDAYRPIPQDVHRQEAFFARWDRIERLGLGIELDPFAARS